MLDWITGQRGPEARELANDTLIDLPETPAPVFAVRAFKHALFGTPKPEDVSQPSGPSRAKSTKSTASTKSTERFEQLRALDDRQSRNGASPAKVATSAPSPTKPASIMMTPGATSGRRKMVVFGEGVLDNEGKKPILPRSRTELPNDFPGKFPSPYTPKEQQGLQSRSAPSLSSLRDRGTPATSATRWRSKDDADITLDLMEPRSESGRYWKDLHATYALQSERQVRKLLTKHKLAKQFAKAKDAEATDAKTKLESERRKFRSRSKELEDQLNSMKEQLRVAIADNTKFATEVALLRKQLYDSEPRQRTAIQELPQTGLAKTTLDVRLDALRPKARTPAADMDDRRTLIRPSKQNRTVPSSSNAVDVVQGAPLAGLQLTSPNPKPKVGLSLPLSPEPLSSDINFLSSPTASATVRSARSASSYRVTKRPITVTMAKARTPSSFHPEVSKALISPNRAPESAVHSEGNANEDNTGLWNLTDLDAKASKTPKTALGEQAAKQAIQGLIVNGLSQQPTTFRQRATELAPREVAIDSVKSAAPTDFPILLTSKERAAKSPRHFPGSPKVGEPLKVSRAPLGSSVGTGNSRVKSGSGKMSEASIRLAARRAEKGKAPLHLISGKDEHNRAQENGLLAL